MKMFITWLVSSVFLLNAYGQTTVIKDKRSYLSQTDSSTKLTEKISALSPLIVTPVLLNLKTKSLPIPVTNCDNCNTCNGCTGSRAIIDTFLTDKMHYGSLLFSGPLYESPNTGFNFSPSRDLSEAALWNPSAIAFSPKKYGLNLSANIKNNYRFTAFAPITKKLSVAAGGIYTSQEEYMDAAQQLRPGFFNYADSIPMTLKESAAFVGLIYKVNNWVSVGISGKSVWQEFRTVIIVNQKIKDPLPPAEVTFNKIKKKESDFDISATFKIKKYLQIGINLMNLRGTELYANPNAPYANSYTPGTKSRLQNQRSLGLGLLYSWKRFNVGTDLLFTKDGLFDETIAVNYVPFNNALLSAGMSVKQLSYSVAFRIKYFRLAYINDNEWQGNLSRARKKTVLNGRIYAGFRI